MLTYVVGDLFQSPARVLVNTVNTVGVMGKGIAKDFKTFYPEMFKQYHIFCERKQFQVGQLWLYQTKHKWILNFPTKQDWKRPSKLEYVEAGLAKFEKTYADKGIASIAFPMLGCGNGGLDWESEVRPLMEKYLKDLPIDVYIHLYRSDPFDKEHRNIQEIKRWLQSEPESLPFAEVWGDIVGVLMKEQSFFTLDTTRTGFVATPVEQPEPGLEIRTGNIMLRVYQEQLIDLWQHIRGLGFLMSGSVPDGLEQHLKYLVAILHKLPYLKPVLISSNYQDMAKNPIGLQYIPKSHEAGGLFSWNDIHEVTIHEQTNEV